MRILRSPFVSALLGGLIVAVAFLIAGVGSDEPRTTVVQQPTLAQPATASSDAGLTINQIYKRDAPGVVFIRATVVQQSTSPFGTPQAQRGVATGSGFVIDTSGNILTNNHVVAGASKVTVQFEDKKTADAKVVGTDPSNDLALLKVDPSGLKLAPLTLGSSKAVQVGDPAIAIGNPFGLDRTLTTGVISALQRQIRAPNDFTISNVIQTDAAINPGNSGGPLLDAAGRVIGINSQIETGGGSSGNVGIGFAVPIDTAKQVLPKLKQGDVKRAYLGVSTTDITPALRRLGIDVPNGALITAVTPGGPAEKAGLRAGDTPVTVDGAQVDLGGDVIRKLGGETVRDTAGLGALVSKHKPGDKVTVEVLRNGKSKSVDVTLANRPAQAPQ